MFTPPDFIESANFALETAVKVIEHYEEYFGIPYPLPKQGLVVLNTFCVFYFRQQRKFEGGTRESPSGWLVAQSGSLLVCVQKFAEQTTSTDFDGLQ